MGLFLSLSPPRIYTVSKQLIGGDDFNNLSSRLNSAQSLLALGNSQATAAQINAANVEILNGSGANTGVLLPISYPGLWVCILNNSLNTENIYPNGTDQIQNAATGYAAASVAVTMATLVNAEFFCIKKGFWQMTKTTGP